LPVERGVRIVIDQDVILLHEDKLDYFSDTWRDAMTLQRDEWGYEYWLCEDCDTSVFLCLQQWLYEQKIPDENSIVDAGYSPPPDETDHPQAKGKQRTKLQPQDSLRNGQSPHSNTSPGKFTEPLTCLLAVDLYFLAWNLCIPQLMDDAVTHLFDHYTKEAQTIPSPAMVQWVFKNGNPVGQHIHYLIADLFLRFGKVDCSALSWAGEDVKAWPWAFLQFFLGRCRMLGVNQGIPSPKVGGRSEQEGGVRSATGEVVPRKNFVNRLCNYHHHAGSSVSRQPRRGRCEYLNIKDRSGDTAGNV
jgi:hypothetical protein